jgi:hypothetical protein
MSSFVRSVLTRGLVVCAALSITAGSAFAQDATPTPKPLKLPATAVRTLVKNTSNTCVWITIYWATFYTPYSIMGDSYNRPRFLKPGESFTFEKVIPNPVSVVPIPTEIKVRGEFKRNADCSGPTIRDDDAQNKGVLANADHGLIANIASMASGSNPYFISPPR